MAQSTALDNNFADVCPKRLLVVVSNASQPSAFITAVPPAPPRAFDIGPIAPFILPVIVSYPKSAKVYSFSFPKQSDAFRAVLTTAPDVAAKPIPAPIIPSEAPAVNGAAQIPKVVPSATTPTDTMPEAISATTSTDIC